MMSPNLFSEISDFNLDQLIAVQGWRDEKPQKVYRNEQSQQHYLHDETAVRLFALQIDPGKLKDNNEYENIVASYLARRDGQRLISCLLSYHDNCGIVRNLPTISRMLFHLFLVSNV